VGHLRAHVACRRTAAHPAAEIGELQAAIGERNEERAALRRVLADLIETHRRSQRRQPEPTRGGEPDDDHEGMDELPEGMVRPVRKPRFRAAVEVENVLGQDRAQQVSDTVAP
jgi:hypothetical protein